MGEVEEARFPSASGGAELRGIVHAPERPSAGLVITHGRSNDLRNPLVRRVAEAVASQGIWALRLNLRYGDGKAQAPRDLSREAEDLRGALRFAPEVLNRPEWPFLIKRAWFVQGDRDPFCDLERLRSEIPKLKEPADLVVIQRAGHSFEPIGGKRDTFPEVQDAMMDWIRGHIPTPDGHSVAR